MKKLVHPKYTSPYSRSHQGRRPEKYRNCLSDRIRACLPFFSTGGNGVPVPMIARSSVSTQGDRSVKPSLFEMSGWIAGKFPGRATFLAIALTTSSEKTPGFPRDTGSAPSAARSPQRQATDFVRMMSERPLGDRQDPSLYERFLERQDTGHAFHQQTITIYRIEVTYWFPRPRIGQHLPSRVGEAEPIPEPAEPAARTAIRWFSEESREVP